MILSVELAVITARHKSLFVTICYDRLTRCFVGWGRPEVGLSRGPAEEAGRRGDSRVQAIMRMLMRLAFTKT